MKTFTEVFTESRDASFEGRSYEESNRAFVEMGIDPDELADAMNIVLEDMANNVRADVMGIPEAIAVAFITGVEIGMKYEQNKQVA